MHSLCITSMPCSKLSDSFIKLIITVTKRPGPTGSEESFTLTHSCEGSVCCGGEGVVEPSSSHQGVGSRGKMPSHAGCLLQFHQLSSLHALLNLLKHLPRCTQSSSLISRELSTVFSADSLSRYCSFTVLRGILFFPSV